MVNFIIEKNIWIIIHVPFNYLFIYNYHNWKFVRKKKSLKYLWTTSLLHTEKQQFKSDVVVFSYSFFEQT